jgi:hypothetical protein
MARGDMKRPPISEAMRTIVTDIRQGASAEDFIITVLVDDHQKTFHLSVDVLSASDQVYGVYPENGRDFENTFEYSMAPRNIADLVIRSYKGEVITLPVDLGDI